MGHDSDSFRFDLQYMPYTVKTTNSKGLERSSIFLNDDLSWHWTDDMKYLAADSLSKWKERDLDFYS